MNKYLAQLSLTPYFSLFLQIFRFGIVGIIAAIFHVSIVIYLVQQWFLLPLVANIFAFMFSFQLSYWGHRLWTFSDSDTLHSIAIPRLLFIQLINFAANETLFFIFLSLNLPYPIALILVLTILPLFTFITSKFWVFR